MKLTKTQFKEYLMLKNKYKLDNIKPYGYKDIIDYLFYLIEQQDIEVLKY